VSLHSVGMYIHVFLIGLDIPWAKHGWSLVIGRLEPRRLVKRCIKLRLKLKRLIIIHPASDTLRGLSIEQSRLTR
jgi:hypothetical protein